MKIIINLSGFLQLYRAFRLSNSGLIFSENELLNLLYTTHSASSSRCRHQNNRTSIHWTNTRCVCLCWYAAFTCLDDVVIVPVGVLQQQCDWFIWTFFRYFCTNKPKWQRCGGGKWGAGEGLGGLGGEWKRFKEWELLMTMEHNIL